MLQHFCASEVAGKSTAGLFNDFAIARVDGGKWMKQHQGKYPVIFISFKDVKESSYELAVENMRGLIRDLYDDHLSQLDRVEDSSMKDRFNKFLYGETNDEILQDSLRFLSEFLFKASGMRAIILIDEYDTPLWCSYQKNYLDETSMFFRNMLSAALKGNSYLEKGLMIGILRVSKNQMLSGLNNLNVYTLLEDKYNQYFGFTEDEVKELMIKFPKGHDFDKVKEFYNGYVIGSNQTMFNPFSLMNYFRSGELSDFWVSTSSDCLLKKLFLEASSDTKEEIACLMKGESIKGNISVNTSYEALMNRPAALWTLLLFTGYLTYIDKTDDNADTLCNLRIPNREVLSQYNTIFTNWLRESMGGGRFQKFVASLLSGNVTYLTEYLGEHLSDALSCRDVGDVKGDNFYHDFVAALIASVSDTHFVDSNKDSSKGYYDVLLTPKKKDHGDLGILFEFKHVTNDESLQDAADGAVSQIEEKEYPYPKVLQRVPHVTRGLAIGLAFCGKDVVSAYKWTNLRTSESGDIYIIKRCMDNMVGGIIAASDREEPPMKKKRNKKAKLASTIDDMDC